MTIFVIAEDGTKLMPTHNIKKVRRILRSGRARVCKYEPFTIQLNYTTNKYTQPIECKQDAGYQTIGFSICSKKHEYVSEERILLKDEVEHHHNRRRYRKNRRAKKRYRAPRFDNRTSNKKEGWLAPSLRNKKDQHVRLLKMYNDVLPITSVVIEVAQFDTQLLKAVQDGASLPSGTDYQYGERYGYDTLREAVFARDGYTCIICKRNAIKDKTILRIHHVGFWRNDRTNRLSNLATVCTKCHTPKNHKPNGKLYGLSSISKTLKSAAFMNSVKYAIVSDIKKEFPTLNINVTFGARTKRTRNDLNIIKSHANDAYCMGEYRPLHRAKTIIYQKRRRNNRILERFFDAKFVDKRDKTVKSGMQMSCNRTTRKEPRNNPQNERIYRLYKQSRGYRAIRRTHYTLHPGDIVIFNKKKHVVKAIHVHGTRVILKENNKSIAIDRIKLYRSANGWKHI